MSNVVRLNLGILAAVVIAGILAYMFVNTGRNCAGYQVMQLPSPTSAFLATVENNTCTPSHEPQTVVEVAGGAGADGWAFEGSSHVFPTDPHTTIPVTLTWLGDAELQIAYPRGTEVQSRRESIGNVKLVYKGLERQP